VAKLLTQLIEADWRRSQILTLMIPIVGLAALGGLVYLTVSDVGSLLVHMGQLGAPALMNAALSRLQLEIAAEAVKVFLDVYLLAAILWIFAPGLYTRFVAQRANAEVQGVEFAAAMFLTHAADLPKWLLGVTLARVTIGYGQKLLRWEAEGRFELLHLI